MPILKAIGAVEWKGSGLRTRPSHDHHMISLESLGIVNSLNESTFITHCVSSVALMERVGDMR